MNMYRELLNSIPMFSHDFRMFPVGMLRHKFGDVVDLEIVLYARDKIACACWFPPVVVPLFESGPVGLFFCGGEREHRLGEGELGVNVAGAEAVIFDVEEACP